MDAANQNSHQTSEFAPPASSERPSQPPSAHDTPNDVEMRQEEAEIDGNTAQQPEAPSAEAAAALPPTAYTSAPAQPPQSIPVAPEPPPTPEPPHAQLPSADPTAQPPSAQHLTSPAEPSSSGPADPISHSFWTGPTPGPIKPDPASQSGAPNIPPATAAARAAVATYSTEAPPAPPPVNYHPNTHGSPTRVYINQNVTPHLLEGMKYLAVYEPEKPLRWLSEFLGRRSREVEG